MKQMLLSPVRMLAIGVCSLFLIVLFTACDGTTINGASSITGVIQSVNTAQHQVTLLVNGQQFNIDGLSDQQAALLQSQQGRTYTLQVTPNGTNNYTIISNSDPQDDDNPSANASTTGNQPVVANEPASIEFVGSVQSVGANAIAVRMPNGDVLSMNVNAQTDRSDLFNGQLSSGQQVKVEAQVLANNQFTAVKLETPSSDDSADQAELNTVTFSGTTTSAVGSDNVVHFNAGNKSYSYNIGPTTQIEDFASAQSIGSNQPIKLEVLFQGAHGTITKVESGND
jgi:hypothetical protein